MVVYVKKHTRDTYKLCNPETKSVIMIRDIKWEEWKNNDPMEIMNIFLNLNENQLVSVI